MKVDADIWTREVDWSEVRWSASDYDCCLKALHPKTPPTSFVLIGVCASEPKRGEETRDRAEYPNLRIPHPRNLTLNNMPSMDYNPRMSMARSSQPQSSQQKPKRDDDEDAFMKLVCQQQHAKTT
jgi:hypothetical protein